MVERPIGASITHYRASRFYGEDLDRLVGAVKELEKKRGQKFSAIYALPRGGLTVGVALSHALKINLLPAIDDLRQYLPSEVLIVDDIADYGRALRNFTRAYRTLTIFKKPRSEVVPDIYLHEVENGVWVSHFWADGDGRFVEE